VAANTRFNKQTKLSACPRRNLGTFSCWRPHGMRWGACTSGDSVEKMTC